MLLASRVLSRASLEGLTDVADAGQKLCVPLGIDCVYGTILARVAPPFPTNLGDGRKLELVSSS